ncbi:hypothetical protein ACFYSW_27685 [Rhodococcus aetherivorans]|uniref:hypothetical protein n=1 Tax=Rhodococcus aetherivorans TaxID=191292 RepID=UPI00368B86A1
MTIASIAQLAAERRAPMRPSPRPGGDGAVAAAGPGDGHTQTAETGASVLARSVPTDIIVFYTAMIGLLQGIQTDSHTYLPLRWAIYGISLAATIAAVAVAFHFAEPANRPREDRPAAPVEDTPVAPVEGKPAAPGTDGQVEHRPVGDGPGAARRAWLTSLPGRRRRRRTATERERWKKWKAWKPPTAETAAATFAFAVWGLITPGSPMYAILESPVLPITIGMLSAGGGLVMSIVFTPILKRRSSPAGEN